MSTGPNYELLIDEYLTDEDLTWQFFKTWGRQKAIETFGDNEQAVDWFIEATLLFLKANLAYQSLARDWIGAAADSALAVEVNLLDKSVDQLSLDERKALEIKIAKTIASSEQNQVERKKFFIFGDKIQEEMYTEKEIREYLRDSGFKNIVNLENVRFSDQAKLERLVRQRIFA